MDNDFVFAKSSLEDSLTRGAHMGFIETSNIQDEKSALIEYHDKLGLPDYLGFSWNSLDEVLQDTDWMKTNKVIVIHDGLPRKLPLEDLKIFLKVLRRSINEHRKDLEEGDWLRKKKVEFVVVFPNNVKGEVENILKQNEEENEVGLTSRKA